MFGESTTVNKDTKYIGALGFNALHRKPIPILFLAEYLITLESSISSLFNGLERSPLTPR